MRTKIVPGGELDILTPDEATSILADILAPGGRPEDQVRAEKDGQTDGNGAIELSLYTVPVGQAFHLTRLIVKADGFTPATEFTAAGAYLLVLRNDVEVDFTSLEAAPGLPAIAEYGSRDAPYFTNGDRLAVQLVLGPVSTRVLGRFEGWLEPLYRPAHPNGRHAKALGN